MSRQRKPKRRGLSGTQTPVADQPPERFPSTNTDTDEWHREEIARSEQATLDKQLVIGASGTCVVCLHAATLDVVRSSGLSAYLTLPGGCSALCLCLVLISHSFATAGQLRGGPSGKRFEFTTRVINVVALVLFIVSIALLWYAFMRLNETSVNIPK
jgi:hypothetical protein